MLCVVTIYEESLTVGQAVSTADWKEARDIAFDWVMSQYESLGYDFSGDTKMQLAIQEEIENRNNYLITSPYITEDRKSIVFQIIEVE